MNKRLVGLVCWRIIMNCPFCQCGEMSVSDKKDFEEDFYSLYQVAIPKNLPLYNCYKANIYELAKKLSSIFFAYRGESINLISKDIDICKCSVIYSLSALSTNPEIEFEQLIESKVLTKSKLEKITVFDFNQEGIFKIKLNAIFQEIDEYPENSVRYILNYCRISLFEFREILKVYLGFNIKRLFIDLDKPFTSNFLNELAESNAWYNFKNEEPFHMVT